MPRLITLLAGCALAAITLGSDAQEAFPSKPIRVVIPFPAGGAVDTLIRGIGPELQKQLGQPIVVDNRPGGGAQIGVAAVMQAPADGHTLFAGEIGAYAINPSLYRNISYQPVRDLAGVSLLVNTPMVMYGSPSGRITGLPALRSVLAQGTPVTYGSFGPGTAPHILGHQLARATPRASVTHVPYKGAPPAFQAIMANEIDLLFDGVPGTLNMVRSGKAAPIAVAAAQRSEHLPQIPTTAEIGYQQMVMDLWIGVAVRKGTPPAVVNRLHAAFEQAMSAPEVWKKFSELGYTRRSLAPARFDDFIRSELERYRPVIQETGVQVD
jgi:tripartite-type tricarboxylate transporter receptor subunit TctC